MSSARDVAFIGCRLLAILIVVLSLHSILFNIWYLSHLITSQQQWSVQDKILECVFYAVPIAVSLMLAAILWGCASWVAGKVVADSPLASSDVSKAWSLKSAMSLALTAIGVWVLIDHLPVVVSYLPLVLRGDVEGLVPDSRAKVDYRGLIAELLAIGLGLLCIIGAERLSEVFAKLRRC